jgi:uncharacterized membrane protein
MRKWYPIVLFAATIIVSIVAYPKLPDRVPTHWGLDNGVNGYSSKQVASVLMPALILACWAWFRFMPTIDPRRANYAKFSEAYDIIIASVLTLLAVIHVVILGAAVGYPIEIARVVAAVVGVLLIAIGNVLPRARPTWFVGVRTPWTLSNDRVWERTHRVSGYLMVIAGVLALGLAFAPPQFAGVGVGVLGVAAALGSVIYSYVAWRQEMSR